jgi:type VI secretion system secreted protein Hcp
MAFDVFLKIDGVDGESTSKGFEKWINVESFSWGVSNASTIGSATGGGGAGKATFGQLHITTPSQVSSPKLFAACATGAHFPNATIQVRKSNQESFLKFELKEVVITSFNMSGRSGDALPHDAFVLDAQSVTESVAPRLLDGALGAAVLGAFDFYKPVG